MSQPRGEGVRLAFLSTSTMAVLVAVSWVACNSSLNFGPLGGPGGGSTGGASGGASGGAPVTGSGGDAGGIVSSGGVIASGGMTASGGMGTGGMVAMGGSRSGGAPASGGRATGGMMASGGAASGGFTGTCTSDANCSGLRCDTTGTHTCVECLPASEGADCPMGLTKCDPATHRCVQCLSAGAVGCVSGQLCLQSSCITTCPDDTLTNCPTGTTNCDDPALAGGNRICMACEVGSTTSVCRAGFFCTDAGQCFQCATDANCTSPGARFCDPARHRCVPCLAHSDCQPNVPVCDFAAGICRAP